MNEEYDVVCMFPYTVIAGKNAEGPIEETRLAFIYLDNREPVLVKDFENSSIMNTNYGEHILVGDENKYVIVRSYRSEHHYLYMDRKTYYELFPEVNVDE